MYMLCCDHYEISSLVGRGPRGTWIRFVLVQIGTRRLGTRSGLACQVARLARIRDAPGFSQRHSWKPGLRVPDELLRRFRKASGREWPEQ